MSWGRFDVRDVVAGLFNVPYHRVPFLAPGRPEIGFGSVRGGATVVDFGNHGEGVVVYPVPDQRGLNPVGSIAESPNPMRVHEPTYRTRPVGQVITYCAFGSRSIRVLAARLSDADGAEVPCWLNSPANDDHCRENAHLIPKSPLRPGTAYSVDFQVRGERGGDLSRRWQFTTASSPARDQAGLEAEALAFRPNEVKLRGRALEIADDEKTLVVAVEEIERPKTRPRRLKTPLLVTFDVATANLRSVVDPLGIDMDRVLPGRDKPVVVLAVGSTIGVRMSARAVFLK